MTLVGSPAAEVQLAVIVPTLQRRPEYLARALESAIDCAPRQIVVISTQKPLDPVVADLSKRCTWIVSSSNLPASINEAVRKLDPEITHFSWIGDDDMLSPAEFRQVIENIAPGFLLIAWCNYIDGRGRRLWTQKPTAWRLWPLVLSLVSSPVAQPSTIISRKAFDSIGGIDASFPLAFDQDLLTRLISSFGRPRIVRQATSSYRVHGETLSEQNWQQQLTESAAIRLKNAPAPMRWLVFTIDKYRAWGNSIKRSKVHSEVGSKAV